MEGEVGQFFITVPRKNDNVEEHEHFDCAMVAEI